MTKERISPFQFTCIAVCYLLGTILVSVFISHTTGNDSWFIGFAGLAVYLPILFVYLGLAKRYPGMSLFQINEKVFGSLVGRVLSLMYLAFFLSVCALNVMEVSKFAEGFMQGTPVLAINIAFMTAIAYALRKGFMPIARVIPLFVILACIALLFDFLLILSQAHIEFLYPMFSRPWLDYVQGTHIAMAIPYGETLVLLMLLPLLGEGSSPQKPLLINAAVTAIIMFIIHLWETVTLGPLLPYAAMPTYEAVKLIDTITRTESLFAFLLISLTFFKVCILLYACVQGLAEVTRSQSYRPLILPFAAFAAIYALLVYATEPSNNTYWGIQVSPFIWTTFSYCLPLLTIAVMWLKNLFQPEQRQVSKT